MSGWLPRFESEFEGKLVRAFPKALPQLQLARYGYSELDNVQTTQEVGLVNDREGMVSFLMPRCALSLPGFTCVFLNPVIILSLTVSL